ncbi:TAXI family TRAP transporter solute-binding subunit [Acuticoccus mangrovi]|uniref:TAXI family TRAP transporter solute-binding subunit n=1 Tax=Acuticoccus mangrovi TaxID=2796142 RepID=A0A934MFG7_9HYPH|nr:TAXI family TRAP transporter solute-binding subunit [Acuticoccus mangrovi]MBJ3774910.1 TAXI family TRAP transporter solute-binding subunit [Acuticoccus mangrovi]
MMKSLLVALAATLAATAADAQTVRFGAGQQGSQNYGVNAALAQAVDERTPLSAQVQSFGGPTAYLPLLSSGELDFAAVVTPDAGDAVRGKGPFDGNALGDLTLVAPLFPSPVGLMVRADDGIATIADLKGKRVAWGIPAQASLLPYVEGALANGGLSIDDVEQVPVASVANGVDALVDGSVDATLFALRSGKVVQADSAVGGVKWLPFDDSEAAVAAMQAVAPESYLVPVKPEDKVVGAPEPMMTMAYDYVLLANAGVADETVAAVLTMLHDDGAEIAAANRVIGAITEESLNRDYPAFTRHPAAAK